MSKEERNTELDYILCDMFGICMDELDLIDIKIVNQLRKSILLRELLKEFQWVTDSSIRSFSNGTVGWAELNSIKKKANELL